MYGEEFLTRMRRFVVQDLWRADLRPRSLTTAGLKLLQLAVVIVRGFVQDQLLLRASALTYVTVLAMIPLLAVTLAFVDVIDGSEAFVDFAIGQITAVSPSAREWLLGRVRGAQLGSLGTVGAALLLLSTVLALRHLEATLNEIWGVRNSRGWMRRFADYLAVMIVAPILMAVALSLATTFQSEPMVQALLEYPLFATLYHAGLAYAPQAILLVAFTFLYWFFPNTSVRLSSAILGGAVAAVLFSLGRTAYVDFNIGAVRYGALFGAFSALPLVLAWLWLCWAIVLLGAEVAFAHQNLSHYRREARGMAPRPAEREAMGLRIAVAVARAFRDHAGPVTAVRLSDLLDLPVRAVRDLLESFEDAGLLAVCAVEERERAYLPARPIEDILLTDLLAAMRGPRRETSPDTPETSPATRDDEVVAQVVDTLDAAVAEVADGCSLATMLAATPRA